jgi:hypothetical protein
MTQNWLQNSPGQGFVMFACHAARQVSLEHEVLAHFFKDWDVQTRDTLQLYWGGKTLHMSKVYLAAVMVDHPQLGKFVGSGEMFCLHVY